MAFCDGSMSHTCLCTWCKVQVVAKPVEKPVNEYVERIVEARATRELAAAVNLSVARSLIQRSRSALSRLEKVSLWIRAAAPALCLQRCPRLRYMSW